MKHWISLCVLGLSLAGCANLSPHKSNIEQGNVYSEAMVKQLHTGMSQPEVVSILGSPVLENVFSQDHVVFIYTFKPGNEEMSSKRLLLEFKQGRLHHIQEERS